MAARGGDKKLTAEFKVKQVEVLDEKDATRKTIATDAIAHCQKRIDDEVMIDFPAITAQYSYSQGSLHAAVGNEDGAAKARRGF